MMLGEQTINVGYIEFLSSLDVDELQTARRIRDSVQDEIDRAGVPINTNLKFVDSATELFDAIERIGEQALEDGKGVVLQIDAHGASDRSGIVLKNGELVTWSDLKERLITLNPATRFNLLVVSSLCYGANQIDASTPLEESPFWGMVGP